MSELRNQLRAMRDAYRGEKYPGDLARELLAPPPPRRLPVWRMAAVGSALAALAAAVVLWVSIEPSVTPVAPPPAQGTGESAVAAVPLDELGAMPALPDDLPLVPEAQSLSDLGSMTEIGAMPEMPSMDLNFSYEPEAPEDSV